jgi:hypothetical protein
MERDFEFKDTAACLRSESARLLEATTNHPSRLSHTTSATRRDKAAPTSLRLLAVLTVLSKYASALQAARASYPRPSHASR